MIYLDIFPNQGLFAFVESTKEISTKKQTIHCQKKKYFKKKNEDIKKLIVFKQNYEIKELKWQNQKLQQEVLKLKDKSGMLIIDLECEK